jgi:phosphoribosylanthranilate isomerase
MVEMSSQVRRTPYIKICGLRTVEHAVVAANAGADYLGLIFAPGRRQISIDTAAAIAAAVRRVDTPSGQAPALVGVFVNETPARIVAIAGQCGLHALQLSGDERTDVLPALAGWAVFKAVRLNGSSSEQGWFDTPPDTTAILLVDAHVPGVYGGAGVVGDWERAALLARERPVVLAGGLTSANVIDAIRHVRPWGVDVSSGVESDGLKDSAKIHAFIAAVRSVVV